MSNSFFDEDDIVQPDSFFDEADILDDPQQVEAVSEVETPSMLETAATGIGQVLTFGNLDEILASLKSTFDTKTSTSSGLGGRLAGMSMDPKDQKEAIKAEKDLMKNYEKAVKEYRERFKKGEEEHPMTALGSEVVGGILLAFLSGGTSAAGNVAKAATTGSKALLPAAKEAAKIGAGYGAASGLGRAEGDSLAEVAGETALGAGVGGAMGAVTPVLAEAAKAGGRQPKKLLESVKELIPGQESAALGYKAGRAGIKTTVDEINKNSEQVSQKIQKYIYNVFKENGLEKKTIEDLAQEVGVTVNFLEPFETQIAKIVEAGTINPNLAKETNRYINALRRTIRPDSPQLQAIKKLEQKVAEDAAKLSRKGGQIDTVTQTKDGISDLIPLPEVDGEVVGLLARGRAKGADGEMTPMVKHWVKSVIDEPVKLRAFDPENMSPKDAKQLMNVIKDVSGDLNSAAKNETERLARQLGQNLSEIYKTAIDEIGVDAANKKMLDAYRILDKSGFTKKDKRLIDPASVTDPAFFNAGQLRDQQIKFEKLMKDKSVSGFINRREVEESMKRLGPEGQNLVNEMRLASDLEAIKGSLSAAQGHNAEGLLGRASGVAVRGGNLAARAVNKVEALSQPIQKGVQKMSSFSDRLLQTASERLKQSDNPVSQQLAYVVDQILTKDGAVRDAMMFSLSQSPTFQDVFIPEKIQQTRELLKSAQQAKESVAPKLDRDLSATQKLLEQHRNLKNVKGSDVQTFIDVLQEAGTENEKSLLPFYESALDDNGELKPNAGKLLNNPAIREHMRRMSVKSTPTQTNEELENELVERIKRYENNPNYKGGGFDPQTQRWFPHASVEGGEPTLAYGFKLTPDKYSDEEISRFHRQGITEDEAQQMLNVELNRAKEGAQKLIETNRIIGLNQTQKQALTEMVYQMGYQGVSQFKNMIQALKQGDFEGAKLHALDSKWAKQTPNRAKEVANRLTGS
jgi:GH24 family phage-related lysozyme (muramidase)